jgi:hypothetical protein
MEKPDTVPGFLAGAQESLIDRGHALAYRALERESASVARGLQELGLRRGDRVALWLPSIPAWLATFAACARLGAIAVSLNTRFRSAEIADILSRSRCRALVYWPHFRNIDFAGILAACDPGALRSLGARIAYGESNEPRADSPTYDELAALAPLKKMARGRTPRASSSRPPGRPRRQSSCCTTSRPCCGTRAMWRAGSASPHPGRRCSPRRRSVACSASAMRWARSLRTSRSSCRRRSRPRKRPRWCAATASRISTARTRCCRKCWLLEPRRHRFHHFASLATPHSIRARRSAGTRGHARRGRGRPIRLE